jgi:hypothetical protein
MVDVAASLLDKIKTAPARVSARGGAVARFVKVAGFARIGNAPDDHVSPAPLLGANVKSNLRAKLPYRVGFPAESIAG